MSRWKINTEEEMKLMLDLYPKGKLNELCQILNREKKHIYTMASDNNIEQGSKRIGNVNPLLQDTPESLYWCGFLMADGNFKNNKSIRLFISEKDHLEKYSRFTGCNINTQFRCAGRKFPNGSLSKEQTMYYSDMQDAILVPVYTAKYDLGPRKTYNPPKIEIFKQLSDDLFLSLFCGYVDGDGTINLMSKTKDEVALGLRCHKAWLPIYQYFSERIQQIFQLKTGEAKIDKRGKCTLQISNNYLLSLMKKKIIDLRLPFMDRKWSKIQNNYYGRLQIANDRRLKIIPLHQKGMRICDIAEKVNENWFTVRNTIKMWKRDVELKQNGLKPFNPHLVSL